MALPTITSPQQLLGGLKQWQQQLNPAVSLPPEPRAPFNLRISSGTATNSLSWEKVSGAQGYEVQVSQNGDFTSAPIITTPSDSSATSHVDPTIVNGVKRWYRIRTTTGTANQPGLLKSAWSAPVISTSGSGTTTYDQLTHTPAWRGSTLPQAIGPRRIRV